MENHSAYDTYALFTAASSMQPTKGFPRFNPLKPWEMLLPDNAKKKPFQIPEIPPGVKKTILKYGNRLAGIPNGRKAIHFDFED